ncbi:hypothetical protein B0H17DRAFT_1147199 [Mycena rosella]|uniref:Uncharacterized protein n=1 Tax=Mycena rosella TaxID=1033263 RepID=A0AAD7G426_MYCRO|nr:hypothetical protein B0H17DRAFT_1147199 [Mycena rosella]
MQSTYFSGMNFYLRPMAAGSRPFSSEAYLMYLMCLMGKKHMQFEDLTSDEEGCPDTRKHMAMLRLHEGSRQGDESHQVNFHLFGNSVRVIKQFSPRRSRARREDSLMSSLSSGPIASAEISRHPILESCRSLRLVCGSSAGSSRPGKRAQKG